MIVELWGSLLVLALSQRALPLGISYLVLAAVAVGAYFEFPQAIPFPLGAMVALAQRDGWLFVKAPSRIESAIATVGALAVLVASGFFQKMVAWQVPDLIAGFLLFVCVMRSMPVRGLLSTPFSQLLGRLSFPLYLMQYPVIIALGASAIVVLDGAGWLTPWTAVAIMIGTGIVVAGAAVLYLPVEILTLGFIRRIGRKRAAATA
jgi:peptidoglycan/LPS O-acetylase OafA/YrhL